MATKTIFVCDICGSVKDGIKPYVIESEGRVARVDLCPDDGAMLEKLLGQAEPPRLESRRPRRRARTPRYEGYISTIEEIERLKAVDGGAS